MNLKTIIASIGTAGLLGLSGAAFAGHYDLFVDGNSDLYGSFMDIHEAEMVDRGKVAENQDLEGTVLSRPEALVGDESPGRVAADRTRTELPGYGDGYGSILLDTGDYEFLKDFESNR